jgi:alkane 1-monooxygenase
MYCLCEGPKKVLQFHRFLIEKCKTFSMSHATTIKHKTNPPTGIGFALVLIGYGLSLVLPLCTLAFLANGPHSLELALLWTLPVWTLILADIWSPSARCNHLPALPNWFFDGLLVLLAGLQIAIIFLMLGMVERLGWDTTAQAAASIGNLLAIRVLVGTNSCCSGIALAHELIHRRSRIPQWLGRLLLCLVCYDHFTVEHLRGHHRRVNTADDFATARFGETYADYFRRTLIGQFRNAWRLENQRLGLRGLNPRLLRHRVFQGAIVEILLALAIGAAWGPLALGVFLWQALAAVRLLEAVNYFQHWGLAREGMQPRVAEAWATDSWVTLHVFLGLSRHADHHLHAHRPYQLLRYRNDGPRLPYGYFGMAILAKSFNARYQAIAKAELRARGLGPL